MAGPGGREVGRVSIRALPDTSSFAVSLQAYLDRTEKRMRLNLPVSLDQGDVAKTEAELAALTKDRTVNIDVDQASASLNRLGQASGRSLGAMPALIAAATVAIGGLVAGLPAMLLAIGAPIAAIFLGLDGIKKAAKVLLAPFKELKSIVSATFEKGLKPSIAQFTNIFPVLGNGLAKIAKSLTGLFSAAVKELTSSGGLSKLFDIFTNISTALDKLRPAIGPFISSLLILGVAGTKAFAQIAPALTRLTIQFENFLIKAQKSGQLKSAMTGLAKVIYGVSFAIAAIVAAGIIALDLFNRFTIFVGKVAARTKAAWDGISGVVSSAAAAVRSAVSNAMSTVQSRISRAWNAARTATASAWSAITSTVSRAASSIVRFVTGIPGKISAFVSKMKDIGTNAAAGFRDGILGILSDVVGAVQRKIDAIVSAFQKALAINSPSKVFMAIGASVGEGFQIGMEKSFSGVADSALALANTPITATSALKMMPGDFFSPAAKAGPIRVWVDNVNHFDDRSAKVAESVVADEKAFASTMGRMG